MKRKIVSIFVFLTLVWTAFAIVQPNANAQGDFGISAFPSSQTVNPGGSATFLVTVTSLDGFNFPVTLSATGLPDGTTASFNLNPVTPTGSSILIISTSPDTPTGSFTITLTGIGGGLTRTATSTITVDFGLVPMLFGTFAGRVTDANTLQPIAGATVFVYSSTYYYIYWPAGYSGYYVIPAVTTDSDGYYTITGVPLGADNAPYDWVVCFHADDYSGTYHIATAMADTVTTVDMALHHASITGLVTDATNGNPIAGATMFVYCWHYYYIYPSSRTWATVIPEVTTDENGDYTITSVPLGADNAPLDWVVGFHADSYSGTYHVTTAVADTIITVDMALCHAGITGTVIDANTGLPIPGATISAYSYADHSYAYVYSFTTDDLGVYTLPNLPLASDSEPRNYYVTVSATGYLDQTQSATISCGGDITLDFSLVPKLFGIFTGRVTDANTGLPIAGATVFVYPSIFYYTYWPEGYSGYYVIPAVTTDENGYYTITGVPLGADNAPYDWVVVFHADAYSETYHVTTAVADTVTTVDMALHHASITGKVTGDNTDPIAGATVFVYDWYYYYYYLYPGGSSWWYTIFEVTTDENGYYTIADVPLGADNAPQDWILGFHADDYSGTYHVAAAVADTVTTVDMALCHASITGRVIDANTGEPISGATISAYSYVYYDSYAYYSCAYTASFYTNEEGVYSLPNLPLANDNEPRDYYVTASATGYLAQTKSGTIFCGGIITIDFAGPEVAFGTITGTVTDCITGLPMVGAFIGSTFGGSDYTDEQGIYTLTDVPLQPDGSSRTWEVTAQAYGYEAQTKSVEVSANEVSILDFTLCLLLTNQPPVADAGPDQTLEQTSYAGAEVTLDGSGSTDDGQIQPLTYTWTWTGGSATGVSPPVTFPLGTTTVTLTVYDGQFSDQDTVDITIVDTTPPVITCPDDVIVEQESYEGTVVPLTATATDICDPAPVITSNELAIYPLGTTIVTFTATDVSGNSASCSMTVTVVDTTPPEITLSGNQIVLWPPNHKYHTIQISDFVLSVIDICDANVGIDDVKITSVSSDEPENAKGDGDGNTWNDIVIHDAQTVYLRAEREGTGNGRVYTINFEVTDLSGNTATGCCKIWVPHDQGAHSTAIDDGASAGYTVYNP